MKLKLTDDLSIEPLTKKSWPKFEELFGRTQGANGGCWCMWWRLPRSEWQDLGKEGRRTAFKKIVNSEMPTGILLMKGELAVGWCAVAPREALPTFSRSSVAKPIDANPAWCVSCFFVKAGHRQDGHMERLIRGAIWYAKENGAKILEAFPQEMKDREGFADTFVGVASSFLACGFKEVARRSQWRPAMRLNL